nr:PREDICTED: transmembrane 9 superfamily member 4-like isoform X2 [Anolis carolinensis]|eukprot:XP_008123250.2 PREDICTED: transmembrane 9 superfamily member 4-like isoform X2 [Anolis carolinensis]
MAAPGVLVRLTFLLLPLLFTCHRVSGFYVPGVAPRNFHQNTLVEIKAVKLTSSRTQLPYEYYSLPFCHPVNITYKSENLGKPRCQDGRCPEKGHQRSETTNSSEKQLRGAGDL